MISTTSQTADPSKREPTGSRSRATFGRGQAAAASPQAPPLRRHCDHARVEDVAVASGATEQSTRRCADTRRARSSSDEDTVRVGMAASVLTTSRRAASDSSLKATVRRNSPSDRPDLRLRVEACVEPRPAGTEIAATARTSLAYDRFADKRASGSRPRRVVRRLRYRPQARAPASGAGRPVLGDCTSGRLELPPGFRRALSQKALVRTCRRAMPMPHSDAGRVLSVGCERLEEAVGRPKRALALWR